MKNALRYLNYSPTIKEIDAILVNLRELDKRGTSNNNDALLNLEMNDYVSIALSFIFKILSGTGAEECLSRVESLRPYGEKGSMKYREKLVEVVSEFIGLKRIKEK